MTCGWCGSDDIDYETVDNGVGRQQVTPAICGRCGAVEIGPYDDESTINPIDLRRGWYTGPDELRFVGPPDPDTPDRYLHPERARAHNFGARVLVMWFSMTHIAHVERVHAHHMFRTNCGLVFGDSLKPPDEVITCLECLCND